MQLIVRFVDNLLSLEVNKVHGHSFYKFITPNCDLLRGEHFHLREGGRGGGWCLGISQKMLHEVLKNIRRKNLELLPPTHIKNKVFLLDLYQSRRSEIIKISG